MKTFTASKRIFYIIALPTLTLLLSVSLYAPSRISHVASWGVAVCVFGFASCLIFLLSRYFRKTLTRVLTFAGILVVGSILYFLDFQGLQERPSQRQTESRQQRISSEKASREDLKQKQKAVAESSAGLKPKPENCDYLFSTALGFFSALAEFFPSRGSYRDWLDYPLGLKALFLLFYLLSYMFFASLLLSLLGLKLTNRFYLFLARFFSEQKHVFWCNIPSSKEELLAKDINKGGGNIVIFSIAESDIKDIHAFVDRMQFAKFLLCLRKTDQFHTDCLTAKRHFFLTDDLNWNFRQARKVLDKIRRKKKQPEGICFYWRKFLDKIKFNKLPAEIHFYLRVTDDEKAYWAVLWSERLQANQELKKINLKLTVHLVNEEAIVARQLQLNYPLLSKNTPEITIDHTTCKVNGSFRILLLGFSDGGQAVLREMICNGQFVHADPKDQFLVDVVDRNEVLTSGYAARYRDAVQAYNVSFINKEVLSGDFYSWLEDNLPSYNRIIVSFWNDNLNLELAAIIVRLGKYLCLGSDWMRHRLYVRFSRNTDIFPQVHFFGGIKDCYSKEIIIDEDLDKKAKKVHRIYKDVHKKDSKEWRNLSMFDQESNRATADRFRSQLTLLGMTESDLDPRGGFDPGKARMEVLAETGHLHWNAFQLTHGIRPWSLENITDDDLQKTDHKANDTEEHLRHAAIVAYADLPAVDEKLGHTDRNKLQNNERNLIREMGRVLCEEEPSPGGGTH